MKTVEPRNAPRRPLAELLVQSARAVESPVVPAGVLDIPAADVLAAADLHRLSPAVLRRLKSVDSTPEQWRASLAFRRHEQLMRHLRAVEDLKHAGQVLDNAGIAWCAMKGPVLAEKIWPAPDMRQYLDLDLLVDRCRFGDALAALQDSGVALADRNWPALASTIRAELAMTGRFGSPIDLHWDIAVPRELRRSFSSDTSGMLTRAARTALRPGVMVPVMDPVDTVVHLVFHAAQAGANLLVWMADIRFAAAIEDFDWAEFARRVKRARFEVPAAMVLARVERSLGLGSPVPLDVLLPASTLWGRQTARRDLRYPFPGLPGDPHQSGTMYSAARRGLFMTCWTAGRSSFSIRRAEAEHRKKPARERLLRQDVPDRSARLRYLEAVHGQSMP